jgi:hypothetical protein
MKNLNAPLIAFFFLVFGTTAQAQTAMATLDINNVSATFLNMGDMFWNPVTQQPGYEFPKGSGKYTTFTNAIWCSGYDISSGVLKVAAQSYRQDGNDYWCGPLNSAGTIDSITSNAWDYIWKINASSVDSHIVRTGRTIANTPADIVTWPAKGNTLAAGKGGAALSIPDALAPFVDVNNDGVYNFVDGDYPLIKGKQALWWVFNDVRPHTESSSAPLGLQFQAMAYACTGEAVFDNSTMLNLQIINKGGANYNDFVLSMFADCDLGYVFDDLLGYDSAHRAGVMYNGDTFDEIYGSNLTQHAVILRKCPGDGTSLLPAGSLGTFYNSQNGNPQNALQFRYIQTGRTVAGIPYTRSCNTTDTSKSVYPFVWPDDPSIIGGISQKQCGYGVNDTRMVLSAVPMAFNANQTLEFEFAFTNTPIGSNNNDFAAIRANGDKILSTTGDCGTPSLGITSSAAAGTISIAPNPASDILHIALDNQQVEQVLVLNNIGQQIYSGKVQANTDINCTTWPRGIYIVKVGGTSTKVLLR